MFIVSLLSTNQMRDEMARLNCKSNLNCSCGFLQLSPVVSSHLIGRDTINIPERIADVHSFPGLTVKPGTGKRKWEPSNVSLGMSHQWQYKYMQKLTLTQTIIYIIYMYISTDRPFPYSHFLFPVAHFPVLVLVTSNG